jgi:peptidoglycan/xylan/chitin deacetylase (PgdA/CDA1 family)
MHIFSCDVEEFHVSARAHRGAGIVGFPSPRRTSTDVLLDLLARHGAKGTFFVVGWLADRNPALVRRIAAAGHEIASHSWWHRRIPTITWEEFRDDVTRTRARLEEITGRPVLGFRAPSFSILPGMEWAFDVLLETGHTWDRGLPHSAAGIRLARRPDHPLHDRAAGRPVARDSAGHDVLVRDANSRGRWRLPPAAAAGPGPARPPRAHCPWRGRDVLHPSLGGGSGPTPAPLLLAHASAIAA